MAFFKKIQVQKNSVFSMQKVSLNKQKLEDGKAERYCLKINYEAGVLEFLNFENDVVFISNSINFSSPCIISKIINKF